MYLKEKIQKLKLKAKGLKKDLIPVYYSIFDKRTPLLAKLTASLAIVYLLSPVDLIPDFIPVLGLLDDIIIVPLLIGITIRLIPVYVIEDMRKKGIEGMRLKKKWYFALPIAVIYLAVILIILRYCRII